MTDQAGFGQPGPSNWVSSNHAHMDQSHSGHTPSQHDPTSPSDTAAQGTSIPAANSSTRLNAVAMLKRAASNREMRGPAPAPNRADHSQEPSHDSPGPGPNTDAGLGQLLTQSNDRLSPPMASQPHFFQSSAQTEQHSQHLSPSPIPPHLGGGKQTLDSSYSPTDAGRSGSPATLLARSASASRAEANRSPLPSLEQLRTRILHERGLQRSASASAASAAARAYAMNKLLGYDSSRQGATSPVSDSGGRITEEEEEEEEEDNEVERDEEGLSLYRTGQLGYGTQRSRIGASPLRQTSIDDEEATRRRSRRHGRSSQFLRPPSGVRNSAHKASLRRSRTISGMSQRAEDERKAAFAQAGESDERTGQRKKRMSRLPSRRSTRDDASDKDHFPDLPRSPAQDQTSLSTSPSSQGQRQNESSVASVMVSPSPEAAFGGDTAKDSLSRKPSKREVARTEMMRKLSGRRLGGPSPVSPIPPAGPMVHSPSREERSVTTDENLHYVAPTTGDKDDDDDEEPKLELPAATNEVSSQGERDSFSEGGFFQVLTVPACRVPPGWFDRVGYDPLNRPPSDVLEVLPGSQYDLPRHLRDGYDPAKDPRPYVSTQKTTSTADASLGQTPAPVTAADSPEVRSESEGAQLTLQQQYAFLHMQQLLQQQQQQLMGTQTAGANQVPSDMGDGPGRRTPDMPRTPEMSYATPRTRTDEADARGLLTPSASVTNSNVNCAQWSSPGGLSDMGANLIPSMHLAPYVTQGGLERGLRSDIYTQDRRATPGQSHLQDWPSTPTSSLGGNEYNESDNLQRRSRMSSGDGANPSTRHFDRKAHLDATAERLSGGSPSPEQRASAMLHPRDGRDGRITTPGSEALLDHHRQFLMAPTPSSFDSSFDRTTSRISGATSAGDRDHFLFDSVMGSSTAAASTTTLPPSSSPTRATAISVQQPAGQVVTSPRLEDGGGAPRIGDVDTSAVLHKRIHQLKLNTTESQNSASNEESLLAPPMQFGSSSSDRVRKDIAISPTLLKEFGDGIDWPGQQSANTSSGDTSRVTTPSGSKFVEQFDWQEDSVLSPAILPRKPGLTPQRSLSSHRKAPPSLGVEETRRLERQGSQSRDIDSPAAHDLSADGSVISTNDTWRAQHDGMASLERTAQPSGMAAMPILPGRSSSIRSKSSRSHGESRSASRLGFEPSLRTVSAVSNETENAVPTDLAATTVPAQAQAARGNTTSPTIRQEAASFAHTHANPQFRQVYRSQHHRMPSASEIETQSAYTNHKLTPFPGLLGNQAPKSADVNGAQTYPPTLVPSHTTAKGFGSPAQSPRQSPRIGRPHLFRAESNNSITDRHGTNADASNDSILTGNMSHQADGRMSPSMGLFGSLRRKASQVIRKGSSRHKLSPSVESSPAISAIGSPVLASRSPVRTQQVLPQVEKKGALGSGSPVTSDGRTGVLSPRNTSPDAILPPNSRAMSPQQGNHSPMPAVQSVRPRPRLVEPHSRSGSTSSSASTAQAHPNDSMATARSKQPNAVGDDSLDPGLAAPNPSLLAPLSTAQLEPRAAAMLHRYSQMLTSPTKADVDSPGLPPGLNPSDLAEPPRKVLHCSPVFQIVSSSTIKDRFLILFDDVLVIGKPLTPPLADKKRLGGVEHLNEAVLPNIGWTFDVKNVIELRHLALNVPQENRSRSKPHPLQSVFADAFFHDPRGALADLMKRSGLANKPSIIAQLLVQTPDLDSDVLTQYLCAPERREVLTAFIKLQRVTGVSIESALRSALLQLRFPRDTIAFEAFLVAFASHWVTENRPSIKPNFSERLAADLIFAIMALNDALHGRHSRESQLMTDEDEDLTDASESKDREGVAGYVAPGIFSEPMKTLSKTAFVSAFRTHDPDMVLSDRTLLRIYASVKLDPVQQSLSRDEAVLRRPLVVTGSGLPLKLVYGVPSAPITVSIPEPDSDFALRLYGSDLLFDPPVLHFDKSASRSFTITSRVLGIRHAVFVRAGRNARLYNGSSSGGQQPGADEVLPHSISLTVERAFMQHCFTLTASEPSEEAKTSSKAMTTKRRKFMFSVDNSDAHRQWTQHLRYAISASLDKRSKMRGELEGRHGVHAVERAKAQRAANALAMHVLRQALIPPAQAANGTIASSGSSAGMNGLQRSASVLQGSAGGAARPGNVSTAAGQHLRTPSDSRLAFFGGGNQGTNGGQAGSASSGAAALGRNVSVSRHYYATDSGAGKEERDLLSPPTAQVVKNNSAVNLPLPSETPNDPSGDSAGNQVAHSLAAARIARTMGTGGPEQGGDSGSGGGGEEPSSHLTGHELVTLCRQNSLLPVVLERSGASTARAHNAI
ncbi:unnamed protein product [Sympodiomycopsis kandeliae]